MADSDNFKDIFAAIDEINLPKEKKKKKLEESKSIDQEKVSKPKSPNKNETIPLSTEQLIQQAEKQLNPGLKVKNVSSEKPKRKTKEAQKEIMQILGDLVDEKTKNLIEEELEYSSFEKQFNYINFMELKNKIKKVRSIGYLLQAKNSKLEAKMKDLALTLVNYKDNKNQAFKIIGNQVNQHKDSFLKLKDYSIKLRSLGRKLDAKNKFLEKELSDLKFQFAVASNENQKQLKDVNIKVEVLSEEREKLRGTAEFYKEAQEKLVIENNGNKRRIDNLWTKINSYEAERNELIDATGKLQGVLNKFTNIHKLTSLEKQSTAIKKEPDEIK